MLKASVIRIRRGNTYLLLRKKNGWGLPGGKREGFESPVETALRELEEETGITKEVVAKSLKFIGSYKSVIKHVECEVSVYDASIPKACKVTISDEHLEYKWFGIDEITDGEVKLLGKTLLAISLKE